MYGKQFDKPVQMSDAELLQLMEQYGPDMFLEGDYSENDLQDFFAFEDQLRARVNSAK